MVDTSVLVAGISAFKDSYHFGQNSSADVLYRWLEGEAFVWLITDEIEEEYEEVLNRLGVKRQTIGRLINLLRDGAEEIEVGGYTGMSPDPGDEPFCACAEKGHADFLVTNNPKHFPKSYLSPKVVTAEEFISLLHPRRKK